MQVSCVLAFHAERLEDNQVWRRVFRVAHWMERGKIPATFFVYPFRADVAGRDITERVRKLASLGHEIGQHTHFYAGTKIDKAEKADDLSAENIVDCLHRDCSALVRMGSRPKGFTAGAWLVNGIVLETLVNLGFVYDCSARFPKFEGRGNLSHHSWLRSPELYTNPEGQLLCLPTTCSLGEWFKWGRKVTTDSPVPYQLIYLHDYDLRSLRNHSLLWIFLALKKNANFISAQMLARQLRGKV